MGKDNKAREAVEGKDPKHVEGADIPTAGPHAKEHLTDKSKTPGTGSLPDEDDQDVSPGAG